MKLKMYKYELRSWYGTETCNWSSYYYYPVGDVMILSGRRYVVTKVIMPNYESETD